MLTGDVDHGLDNLAGLTRGGNSREGLQLAIPIETSFNRRSADVDSEACHIGKCRPEVQTSPKQLGQLEPVGGTDGGHRLTFDLGFESFDVEVTIEVVTLVLQGLGEKPLSRQGDFRTI